MNLTPANSPNTRGTPAWRVLLQILWIIPVLASDPSTPSTPGRDPYAFRKLLTKPNKMAVKPNKMADMLSSSSDAQDVVHQSPQYSNVRLPEVVTVSQLPSEGNQNVNQQRTSVTSRGRSRNHVSTTTSTTPSSKSASYRIRRTRGPNKSSTKKTTFSDLLKETAKEKAAKKQRISNAHSFPKYRINTKPKTSSKRIQVVTSSPAQVTATASSVRMAPSYSMSLPTSVHTSRVGPPSSASSVKATVLKREKLTPTTLLKPTSRLENQHATRRNASPTQTISLPPMTVKLFADAMDEPTDMTYGHPDFNKINAVQLDNRTKESDPDPDHFAASGSAPMPVIASLPHDEPYLLPAEARLRISRRSTTTTTTSPPKERTVRHSAQNPYSYRDLFGDDDSPDYRMTGTSGRGQPAKQSTNIEATRQADHRRGVVSVDYEDDDDPRDSSNYNIHAAGSGTRNLYTKPLLQDRPKEDRPKENRPKQEEVSKTVGRTSKKIFSSQVERQKIFGNNGNKNSKDGGMDEKKMMMLMMMMRNSQNNDKKNKNGNAKDKKNGGGDKSKMDENVAKMIDGGAMVVMGDLLPQDPKDAMPAIKALDVVCNKDVMNVTLQFDKEFGGVIYSKGQFGNANCTYVQNDKKTDFNFSVPAPDQCGTKMVEMKGKPAFMENVLIVQNEPGIQEVWDSARGVRCVFDGKGSDVTQKVTAALAVSKIDQQVVAFSADTQATATLDIQVGRGPFAPSAAGLVKIGELMTLVVTVEGPEKASLLVRQCTASDGQKKNSIMLTDNNGCVVKKKLMGSWQITKNTGDKNKPVIAFAHFQAFKFPDQMEVMIECQVDLCSGDCGVCPGDMEKTMDKMAGRRRRRSLPKMFSNLAEDLDELRFEAPEADEGVLDQPQGAVGSPNGWEHTRNHSDGIVLGYHPLETVLSVFSDDRTKMVSSTDVDRTRLTGDKRLDGVKGEVRGEVYLLDGSGNLDYGSEGLEVHDSASRGRKNTPDSKKTKQGHKKGAVVYLGTAGRVMKEASINDLQNLNHKVENVGQSSIYGGVRSGVYGDPGNRLDLNYDSTNQRDVNRHPTNRVDGNRDLTNRMDETRHPTNHRDVNRDPTNRMDANKNPANRVDGVLRVANKLQVLSPEDIDRRQEYWDVTSVQRDAASPGSTPLPCLSVPALSLAGGLLVVMVAVVVLLAAWLRSKRVKKENSLPDDQSFHAFSSVAYR